MWTPLSHNASASRCDKQQIFPYFTVIVANSYVMSSIDVQITKIKIIENFYIQTLQAKVTSCNVAFIYMYLINIAFIKIIFDALLLKQKYF